MSRDPLEGVRPSDSAGWSHAPLKPTIVERSPQTGRRPALSLLIVVAAIVTVGLAGAVLVLILSPAPTSPKRGVVDQTTARQMPRHSPDGAPLTPPANAMTTIEPTAKP